MDAICVKDLESIACALENPDTKSHEYIVQSYGFCPLERRVTPYRRYSCGPEPAIITCQSCWRDFNDTHSSFGGPMYLYGDLVPKLYTDKIEELYSRENQARELFRVANKWSQSLQDEKLILKEQLDRIEQDIAKLATIAIVARQCSKSK